jgi:fucose 4-O-acetylase-like acetyltransferase
VGFLLFSDWSYAHPARAMTLLCCSGVALFVLSIGLNAMPVRLYRVYDYWHTSPNFFLARLGVLLVLMCAAYAWLRRGPGRAGFSPFVQLGQTSLLVYWLHTDFVYGRFSILTQRAQTISMASLGLLAIFVGMLLVSMARTRWKGRGGEILARIRPAPRPATEG